jgi:hypothetical protein
VNAIAIEDPEMPWIAGRWTMHARGSQAPHRHAREGGHPVTSRACDFGIEIDPIRIVFFNQSYFPASIPLLETLFPLYL